MHGEKVLMLYEERNLFSGEKNSCSPGLVSFRRKLDGLSCERERQKDGEKKGGREKENERKT